MAASNAAREDEVHVGSKERKELEIMKFTKQHKSSTILMRDIE